MKQSFLNLSDKGQRKLEREIQKTVEKKDLKRLDKINKHWDILPEKKSQLDKHFEKIEKKESRRFERETAKDL